MFFVAMALVGNCIPFWLISWGQQGIDSGPAGILMAIMPLTTLVLAHLFVDGERLNRSRVLGFAMGFCGIVVLVGPEALLEFEGGGSALLSELAVLSGALCYAVATIVARRRPKSDALVAASGVMIAAAVIMMPLAAASDGARHFELSLIGLSAVAVLGVLAATMAWGRWRFETLEARLREAPRLRLAQLQTSTSMEESSESSLWTK